MTNFRLLIGRYVGTKRQAQAGLGSHHPRRIFIGTPYLGRLELSEPGSYKLSLAKSEL
jgi:hypothetical protein